MDYVSVHAGIRTAPLLERDAELAALAQARAAVVRERRGRVVFVRGEAGIGKTDLLQRFCETADLRVLWAACDPLFTPRPLGPLFDLAAGPGLREQLDAGGEPHDVATALLAELGGAKPVVLVLEDLHWGDEATLDVVRIIARRIEHVPALFLISFRGEVVHRTHPLQLLLGELSTAARIEPAPLSATAVARLAEPAGLDAAALHERTGGNPFFVSEAIAAGDLRIPDTVRDAVLARAARLTLPARDLLDAIAVVPQAVELWLLEALVQLPPGAIDECLSAGILRADGDALAFRHELARLAVEESLAPDRRVAVHRLALVALTDPPTGAADLARLAHHAEAAADGRAVLRYAPAAAEHAARVGAHREAQAQYGRALRFADGLAPEARADLLMRFATEGYLTDMRDDAIVATTEAIGIYRDLRSAEPLADALRLRARLEGCSGWGGRPLADAREAIAVLEGLPPGPALARSYALLAGACMNLDRLEDTLTWSDRALELGERLDDAEAIIRALNYAGAIRLGRGDPDGEALLERSIALAAEHGRHTEVGLGYINITGALGWRRDWRRADRHFAGGIEYCRKQGLEAWAAVLEGNLTWSDLAQGRWDAAAERGTSLINWDVQGVRDARLCGLVALGVVRARRGDPEAQSPLDEAQRMAEEFGQLQFTVPVAAARAEAAWLRGHPDDVAAETVAPLALAVDAGDGWMVGELAVWRRRAGIDGAAPIAEGPWALELAGDHRGAADALNALGCHYDAALALTGSDDEAELREALTVFQDLGARPAAQIVSRRLREGGARDVPKGPRAATKGNPAGLTARELEVLALIAEGLRNADIAQRLVLSEKTVGHHVSNVLRKLDVSTRGQAAARAAKDGLLDVP
ncbi:MAG: hypothetical protein QOF76_3033 [Solirubrobacteraceae bacterium]|jgi:DNA-binding CsgD family transcriptional regulator|nr:hypothetical protein [Solirubrobacteraceae bacterium]